MRTWKGFTFVIIVNLLIFYFISFLVNYYQLNVSGGIISFGIWYLLDIVLFLLLYRYPLPFFNLILIVSPQNTIYRTYRAGLYIKQKRYKRALQDLNHSAELGSKTAETYYYRGSTYMQLAQYQLALQDYDQALMYKPGYSWAYYSKGLAYFSLKSYEQAIENLNQALLLTSDKSLQTKIYTRRGRIYQQMGEQTLALQNLHQALVFLPRNCNIYNACAIAHIRLQEYHLAIQACNWAISINNALPYIYDTRAIAYLGLNNLRQARLDLARAWELDPHSIACGWHREWLRLCQENPDGASVDTLKKLSEMASEHKLISVCEGVALWINGTNNEALQEFDRSIQFEPVQWDAPFWKGMAFASLGRDEEARANIQSALAQGMPTALLSPLRWLEKDHPEFFREFALPLLTNTKIEG